MPDQKGLFHKRTSYDQSGCGQLGCEQPGLSAVSIAEPSSAVNFVYFPFALKGKDKGHKKGIAQCREP